MSKVLYFSAVWCAPCRVMSNSFKKLTEEFPQIDFQKIDVDDGGSEVDTFGVRSIPTMVHLDEEGVEIARVVGSRTKEDLIRDLSL